MEKANKRIVWGSLLSLLLAASFVAYPLLVTRPAEETDVTAVFVAVSLMAAYLILVLGILVVGINTYGNLALRRADAELDTSGNRRHFNAGVGFCILGLALIFFPVL